jgi:hypothetical protein
LRWSGRVDQLDCFTDLSLADRRLQRLLGIFHIHAPRQPLCGRQRDASHMMCILLREHFDHDLLIRAGKNKGVKKTKVSEPNTPLLLKTVPDTNGTIRILSARNVVYWRTVDFCKLPFVRVGID